MTALYNDVKNLKTATLALKAFYKHADETGTEVARGTQTISFFAYSILTRRWLKTL